MDISISSCAGPMAQTSAVWGALGLVVGCTSSLKDGLEAGVLMTIGTAVSGLVDRAFSPLTSTTTNLGGGMSMVEAPTTATETARLVCLIVKFGITWGLAKCAGLEKNIVRKYVALNMATGVLALAISVITYGAAWPIFFPNNS